MSVLVVGATGTVGSEVVRALLERGAPIRALARDPERAAKTLPRAVEIVRGDVRDRASLDRALSGTRSTFYVSPHEPDEEALAEIVIDATARARSRLVFLGVHADGGNAATRWIARVFYGALLPHYRPKLRLSEKVRRAGAALISATNFYQNDELFRDAILAGALVTPLSARGVSRVDVRDIGDVAARVLLDDASSAGVYPVIGPESLSGAACAEIWSRALGRPVRYTGDDFARFETEARRVLADKKLADILASYRALGRISLPTDARMLARTTELLGRPPRSYREYVREAAARWGARDDGEPAPRVV